MQIFTPKVNETTIYKEITLNITKPLELLREAVSNCVDAEAKNIKITIDRDSEGTFIILICDDGNGMNMDSIHRFFNLGDSNKDKIGIGQKGLGTKTFFKSARIVIETQTKSNESYIVTMDNPWMHLLNSQLPQYVVEPINPKGEKTGTKINIEGYAIDNPEKYFNFYVIKDYLRWFTAAGSFKNYFTNYTALNQYLPNMQVVPRVFLEDKVMNISGEIPAAHPFFPPQENPVENPYEQIYKKTVDYCRPFGPFHRETNINGEFVSFQMYGTISGTNCRKSIAYLSQGETLASRFGTYLAKDFIAFTKVNFIRDKSSQHYHILINSQNFELTADRNNLSNADDIKIKWILKEAKKIINNEIIPLAEDNYFKSRDAEELAHSLNEKQMHMTRSLEKYDKMGDLSVDELPIIKIPTSEAQVILLCTALISNMKTKKWIKYISMLGYYSQNAATDMICLNNNGEKILVEFELKLSNLFVHDHPYQTFDCVVCWTVDLEINEKKQLKDGVLLTLSQQEGEWILKCGTEKIIPVIELSKIIAAIKDTQTSKM